jgi:hypothetical protein
MALAASMIFLATFALLRTIIHRTYQIPASGYSTQVRQALMCSFIQTTEDGVLAIMFLSVTMGKLV